MLSFLLLTSAIVNVALFQIARHYHAELEKAENCPSFGCKTRQWVDRRRNSAPEIVIFLDVDKMKEANSLYGPNGVNDRIRSALDLCREDYISTARWQMGDELIAFAKGDGDLALARVELAFKNVGLSITGAWTLRTDDRPLQEWVTPLMDDVMARKAERDKLT